MNRTNDQLPAVAAAFASVQLASLAMVTAAPATALSATALCGLQAPCIGAHSTTRALYAAYPGPLYQVQRASDRAYADIGLLSAGGYANAAAQDSFCAGTSCTITKIYDQTTNHNDLPISWGVASGRAPARTAPTSALTPRHGPRRHRRTRRGPPVLLSDGARGGRSAWHRRSVDCGGSPRRDAAD